MLGLPPSTELKKQLPKNLIYAKFELSPAAREDFDNDISKIVITNEISTQTTALATAEGIDRFYVLLVTLKHKGFKEKNVTLIAKLIAQNLVFVLEYETEAKLAVYLGKLHQTVWCKKEDLLLPLDGLDLAGVWQNIVINIGAISLETGRNLEEQIILDEHQKKLQHQIRTLEKRARSEKQPKRKFELVQELRRLKNELF